MKIEKRERKQMFELGKDSLHRMFNFPQKGIPASAHGSKRRKKVKR